MEKNQWGAGEEEWAPAEEVMVQQKLPSDLPKTLDDRQPIQHYGAETEMYDAWKGQSEILSSPPTQSLAFNLNLNDASTDNDITKDLQDNDSRLMEMLAAQAAHRGDNPRTSDEEAIVNDEKMPAAQKKTFLQKSLHNAASNGDIEQVGRLITGAPRQFIDINGPDEEGTAPIIYASCFVSQLTCQCRHC